MNDYIMEQRIENLNLLRSCNQENFPYRFERTHTVEQFLKNFDALMESKESVVLVGRIMFRNKMGKLMFLRATDDTGKLQWMLSMGEIGEEAFKNLVAGIDIGDICGVRGTAFLTKTEEKTLRVASLVVLAKSIRSLPEKYHGLRDTEIRYRQREIDLIMNPDSARVFKLRSKTLSFIRSWMESKGFMEVETPTLQMIYGGAEAAPFITHVNAINATAYMSISPELFLKRLIVGGFYKVFTISKNFRNEGIDTTHNPEFTLMESYQAFSDYNDVMAMTEQLIQDLCVHLHGTTEVSYKGETISFKAPFQRISFYDAIEKSTGLRRDSGLNAILSTAKQVCDEKTIDLTGDRIAILDKILEAAFTLNIKQPTFIIDYPKETSPLCRIKRGDPDLIERFELYCAGMELANAYSELNDPILQRTLLTNQSRLSSNKDEVPPEPDEYFMQAVEYGMPPTGGLGIGIDRIVMLLTDSASIRDVILFPFMKIDAPKINKVIEEVDE
ncbi:MAG: lysine--tRNA ligase [Firmicutes bacterium]|nr:lysine--tRNA ligase [Bacillota bacterium]